MRVSVVRFQGFVYLTLREFCMTLTPDCQSGLSSTPSSSGRTEISETSLTRIEVQEPQELPDVNACDDVVLRDFGRPRQLLAQDRRELAPLHVEDDQRLGLLPG